MSSPESNPVAPTSTDGANHPPIHVEPAASTTTKPAGRRKWPWVVGLVLLAGAAIIGIPWLRDSLTTVSTDDAYVNGHVTFVAPRVSGQVMRVLVDDNNAVRKSDLLVELDPEPFQVQVNIAKPRPLPQRQISSLRRHRCAAAKD